MDETLGPGFDINRSNLSSNECDAVNIPENSGFVAEEGFGTSNRTKLPEIHTDESSSEKMAAESLNSTDGGWNELVSADAMPDVHETTSRPIISVRKTEDLFAMADGTGDRAGVEESAIAVSQEPVRENFCSQPSLPQFDNILRNIGSDVVAYPVNQMKRSTSLVEPSPEPKQRKVDVRLPTKVKLPDSITVIKKAPPQPIKKSIAEMLANRDITVSTVGAQSRKISPSVSISSNTNRLPTVDLTKESDKPRRSITRLSRRYRGTHLCQICDKTFLLPQDLAQHMACHRGAPQKVECKECTAQYSTQAELERHRRQYHRPPPDMAIPIVDLEQSGVLSKLNGLGVRWVIPLAQLHGSSGGGSFGLPVVSVGAASNPALCDIGHLGASNILPIGPLKAIAFDPAR